MSYSEFSFIESIKNQVPVPAGFEGIGDDCAIIDLGNGMSQVITADMLIEGVHFLRDKISPYQLGRKAVAVNLSDVASMGAAPTAIFLSISVPKELDNRWLDEFIRGVLSWGVPLLGGDTTGSLRDIAINITACGTACYANIKRRNSARVGDTIFITGNLGDSAAGLKCILNDIASETLITSHNNPKPFVNEGVTLGSSPKVHAMMDVSDGIASDLKHILRASKVSAVVDTTKLPLSDTLINLCNTHDFNLLELALGGGEDYVLLLTADEDLKMPFPIYPIGKIENGSDCTLRFTPQNIDIKGFTHF